jgi:hypothetical protein
MVIHTNNPLTGLKKSAILETRAGVTETTARGKGAMNDEKIPQCPVRARGQHRDIPGIGNRGSERYCRSNGTHGGISATIRPEPLLRPRRGRGHPPGWYRGFGVDPIKSMDRLISSLRSAIPRRCTCYCEATGSTVASFVASVCAISKALASACT